MHNNYQLFPAPKLINNVADASQVFGFGHLANLPGHGCFYLHARWPSRKHIDFPAGFDYYVISFHMEHVDFDWLKRQTVGPIIVLSDFNSYNEYLPDVHFFRWIAWHHAIKKIQAWYGSEYKKNIQYKASAFCNRVTQSKIIVTAALAEYIGTSDALLSLSDWVEDKNVHNWQPTGQIILDNLTDIFRAKYLGQKWTIDSFDRTKNDQSYTSNPAHPAYQEAAIHFTNESFHYSLMQEDSREFILPGPHLTEKTFKCLLGGTAFIPVGQFDVYPTLSKLGLRFDYNLDLSFDQDPGNLTRLIKTVDLINTLSTMTAMDIYEATKDSTEYNHHCVISGEFFGHCENNNIETLDKLYQLIK
jgi:hypothetical protein